MHKTLPLRTARVQGALNDRGAAIEINNIKLYQGVVYEKEKDSIVNYDSSLHYVLSVWMFAKGTICR